MAVIKKEVHDALKARLQADLTQLRLEVAKGRRAINELVKKQTLNKRSLAALDDLIRAMDPKVQAKKPKYGYVKFTEDCWIVDKSPEILPDTPYPLNNSRDWISCKAYPLSGAFFGGTSISEGTAIRCDANGSPV